MDWRGAAGRVLESNWEHHGFIPTGLKSAESDWVDFTSREQSENEGKPPLPSSEEITSAVFVVPTHRSTPFPLFAMPIRTQTHVRGRMHCKYFAWIAPITEYMLQVATEGSHDQSPELTPLQTRNLRPGTPAIPPRHSGLPVFPRQLKDLFSSDDILDPGRVGVPAPGAVDKFQIVSEQKRVGQRNR